MAQWFASICFSCKAPKFGSQNPTSGNILQLQRIQYPPLAIVILIIIITMRKKRRRGGGGHEYKKKFGVNWKNWKGEGIDVM